MRSENHYEGGETHFGSHFEIPLSGYIIGGIYTIVIHVLFHHWVQVIEETTDIESMDG